MEKNSAIKVIGPRLYNAIGLGLCLKHRKETECAWVSGAAFMIKRSTFEEIGGFDENFFLYKEENLCLRIRRKNRNAKIIYYPEAKICHIGSVVAKREDHFKKSINYFLKKHPIGKRN